MNNSAERLAVIGPDKFVGHKFENVRSGQVADGEISALSVRGLTDLAAWLQIPRPCEFDALVQSSYGGGTDCNAQLEHFEAGTCALHPEKTEPQSYLNQHRIA